MAVCKHILYHWTHPDNLKSISETGLDPEHATGEMFAVWGCERSRIEWAREHVAKRHGWPLGNLVLLRCHTACVRTYRSCWTGVFYTPCVIQPQLIEVVTVGGEATPIVDHIRAPEPDLACPD